MSEPRNPEARTDLPVAESAGGGLRAVHAWAPSPAHSSMYVSDCDIAARHAEERIAKWFEAARAERYRVRPEIRVVRGGPAEVLIEQSRDADLVVAGSHRSLLPRRGVGPVLPELLIRAKCPIAVVPVH